MSPRGAAFLVVVVLIALGAYAGWLVGIPTPAIALVAGLAFGVALRRLRRAGPARAASASPGPSKPVPEPPGDGKGVGMD